MQAISSGLGSGALKTVSLGDVIEEDWAETLTLDLKVQASKEFMDLPSAWHCAEGICPATMKQLNDEFNLFRSLFPLKVYVGGPPASGKTHYSKQLASSYGIPHLMIGDMIKHASNQKDELGDKIRATIEELKDAEVAAYEKTRKKKDPDLDRSKINVRLPDELLQRIVKEYLASPACMNKGFIIDGYPRHIKDAQAIFMEKSDDEPKPAEMPADENAKVN